MMRMYKHDEFSDGVVRALLVLMSAMAGMLASSCGGVAASTTSSSSSFGVNYGKIANDLPPPAEVVGMIQSLRVTKSKLYDADPVVLRTFGNTGISFIVGIANEELAYLGNPAVAQAWVQANIAAYLPATNIIGIVVGNEIFSGTDTTMMAQVLPAMNNVYAALEAMGLQDKIAVSTAHSFSTLSSSYPPSAGAFNPAIANLYMKPVLDFLARTNAPFLINVYPFFAYKDNPTTISLSYVLFQENPGVRDDSTGLVYYNMFDAQMDAVYSAIAALGHTNLTLLVSETGWPSAGDPDEPGASIPNAQTYHANLVHHVISQRGTPLRPNTSLDVYLFALFNEDMKPGPTSERNYGLFRPDGSRVYNFQFYQSSSSSSSSASPLLSAHLLLSLLLLLLLPPLLTSLLTTTSHSLK